MRLILMTLVLMAALYTTGCSTTPKQQITLEPTRHRTEDIIKDTVKYPIDVHDPIEGFNRRVYTFNYYFDKYFFLPVVKTYAFITPDVVENRVSDFVSNVYEFNNLTNNLLQLKFKRTGITLARILTNTTMGIAGLWDPATGWDLPSQPEDFGQTLGHYGVGNGPYIVLPILGPSNLRDSTGTLGDFAAFHAIVWHNWVDDDATRNIFGAISSIDKRHRTSFRYYQSGSPFEYDMVRMLYTSKREIEIAK